MEAVKEQDTIRVVCRFRPFNETEKSLTGKQKLADFTCVSYNSTEAVTVSNPQVKNSGHYPISLDRIFSSDTEQHLIYHEAASRTVMDVLNGYNGTIFTYGQSGSGKTFTMYGADIYNEHLKGIVPRTM